MGGNSKGEALRLPTGIAAAIALLIGLHAERTLAEVTWKSGTRNNRNTEAFTTWCKTPIGRAGDKAQYIQDMHDLFVEAGPDLAHEAYNNAGKFHPYPVITLQRSSALYQELFGPPL